MYAYVIILYINYGILCNCFDFRDCWLPTEQVAPHTSPFFPSFPGLKVLKSIKLDELACYSTICPLWMILWSFKPVYFSLEVRMMYYDNVWAHLSACKLRPLLHVIYTAMVALNGYVGLPSVYAIIFIRLELFRC